jgi:hypothetical protein
MGMAYVGQFSLAAIYAAPEFAQIRIPTMNGMILVFVPCKNKQEAEKIGLVLVQKRLAVCSGFIPRMSSVYWWPPKA